MPLHADDPSKQTPTAHIRWFPGHPTSISEVRRFVSGHLQGSPRTDDALLLASEITTNAIEHTESSHWQIGFVVTVEFEPGQRVRIAVRDAGDDSFPERITADVDSEHGRGLFLVSLIADDWGTSTTENGKFVWFDLKTN